MTSLALAHPRRHLVAPLSLLIVDPADEEADFITDLAARGVETTTCHDGADALLQVGRLEPDVVLLGPDLPTVPSVAVARAIRHRQLAGVIVGVGEHDSSAAAEALTAGAMACVAWPYRLPELLPLLAAIRPDVDLDRSENVPLSVGPLRADPRSYEVRVDGRPVDLTVREFDLLVFLMRNTDRVVTPEQILTAVWRKSTAATNTLTVHIRRLRIKLGDDLGQPRLIRNVRGLGYRLTPAEL